MGFLKLIIGLIIGYAIGAVLALIFGGVSDKQTISVRCPYCNSYNTTKISTMSKAISAALIGELALSRNLKQWHCYDCGSDF